MHIPHAFDPVVGILTTSLLQDGAQNDPSDGKYSSLIGIVTAIVGNTLISFALNIQRYAHVRLERARAQQTEEQIQLRSGARTGPRYNDRYGTIPEEEQDETIEDNRPSSPVTDSRATADLPGNDETQPLLKQSLDDDDSESASSEDTYFSNHYLRSPWWWLGIILMTIGESGNFLAYGFAPASIVSPLGVVALVANCLIAPLMLGEHFRLRDGLGVLVAIGGCVTVVLSATGSDPQLDQDQIWSLITTWEFELYVAITLVLIIALMIASNRYPGRIFVDLGLMALFGAYTALATKGVASLLSHTYWRVITFPLTYLLLAALVTTAVMQIHYINKALQTHNSTQVIPVQFVLFTISVIVGSAVLYRDFESKTAGDAGKFVGGCLLTFFGVWCITAGRHSGRQQGQTNSQEPYADDSYTDVERIDANHGNMSSETRERSQQTPVFKLTTHQDGSRSNSHSPGFSTVDQMPRQGVLSSIDSAIHANSAKVLSPETSRSKPQLHATTSTPLIPTSIAAKGQRPTLNPRHTAASPEVSHDNLLKTPDQDAMKSSAQSPIFGSMIRMLPSPGLLTSPLSSSLNAIVIDSLREIESSAHTERRLRSVRSHGIKVSTGLGLSDDTHAAATAAPSRHSQQPSSATSTGWPGLGNRARSEGAPSSNPRPLFNAGRSVSNTIEGFLGLNKKRRDNDATSHDGLQT